MKCKNCYARNDGEKCFIGRKPRMLVCGSYGCDAQARTVERKMGIKKPQTNADRIFFMSVEELAVFIFALGNGREYCVNHCIHHGEDPACESAQNEYPRGCLAGVVAWLKSPVEESE